METLVKKGDVLHNISVFKNQIESTSGAITLLAKSDVIELLNKMQECMETMVEDVPQQQQTTATKFEFTQELKEIISEAIEEAVNDIDFDDSDIDDNDIASLETNEYGNEVRVEICYNASNLNDVVQGKMNVTKIVSTIEENMNAYLEEEKNNVENA
jgi:hypothetical protein